MLSTVHTAFSMQSDILKYQLSQTTGTRSVITALFELPHNRFLRGFRSGYIDLWDARTGNSLAQFIGHTKEIYGLYASPSSDFISISRDGSMKRWDITTEQNIGSYFIPNVSSSLICLDHSRIAMGYEELNSPEEDPQYLIIIFDRNSKKFSKVKTKHIDTITALTITTEVTPRVISGACDGSIEMRPLKELNTLSEMVKKHVKIVQLHNGSVSALTAIPCGFASGSHDHTIKLWNGQGKNYATLEGHADWITELSSCNRGTYLASGSWDRTIKIWNITSKKHQCLQTMDCGSSIIVTLTPVFSSSLISTSDDGSTKIWQLSKKPDQSICSPAMIDQLEGKKEKKKSKKGCFMKQLLKHVCITSGKRKHIKED